MATIGRWHQGSDLILYGVNLDDHHAITYQSNENSDYVWSGILANWVQVLAAPR